MTSTANNAQIVPHSLVRGAISPYDPEKAIRVCVAVAQGKDFSQIFLGGDPFMPTQEEFFAWSLTVPELSKALDAARQLSAFALEDEALRAGREIANVPGSPQRVSAYKAAMEQLRWSAERRNAGAFGNKGVQTTVVPIQIVTNLDLGQPGSERIDASNVYEVRAEIEVEADDADAAPRIKLSEPKTHQPPPKAAPATSGGFLSAAELLEGEPHDAK